MRVYHLLSRKWGLESIARRRLKISRFADLNDPFELLCVNLRDKQSRQAFNRWKAQIDRQFGLMCFSKSWDNPLLWSHYGERYKGLCLGFEVPDEKVVPVRYQSERTEFLQENLDESIVVEFLSTKFVDWAYEKEVRIITDLSDRDPTDGHYYIDFGDDLKLTEIVVGVLNDSSRAELVSEMNLAGINSAEVRLVKARLAFKSFAVVADKRGFK